MVLRKYVLRACVAATFASIGLSAAHAQGYPTRPVTMVVPFAAGGSSDILARAFGASLAARLGQPVIIENKPGAGGIIASDYVARAQPDGYTLLFVSSTYTTNAAIQTSLPFDPVHAFAPVAMVAKGPMILTVNNELPVKTPQELLALAKSQPGKLNYASSGVGSINHFATHQYAQVAGVQMTHVPYKGMAPAINDLIGGHIQVLIASGPSILPTVKAGKVRALGVTSATPSAVAPGLAPLAANGAPGYESGLWWGILTPAGTPAPVVARLNTEINRILGQDEIKDLLLREGAEPDPKTPDAFGAQLRGDIEQWRRIAQQANIKAD